LAEVEYFLANVEYLLAKVEYFLAKPGKALRTLGDAAIDTGNRQFVKVMLIIERPVCGLKITLVSTFHVQTPPPTPSASVLPFCI
jgi:hypothetical protein